MNLVNNVVPPPPPPIKKLFISKITIEFVFTETVELF